jgi:Protein of unknown function (DUF559)
MPGRLPIECRVCPPEADKVDGRADVRGADLRVAAKAAGQWSVLSLDELRACGLSRNAVAVRVTRGWLHPWYRGVYAVGHANPPLEGRFLAAVKACGPDAVLSHFSAAALLGLVRWDGRPPEVTVVGSATRVQRGIRVHRTEALDPVDVGLHQGITITSPARTLVDLAGALDYRRLRRVVRQAQSLRHVDVRQLAEAVARLGPRRGARNLRRILATGPAPTRSELEDTVLDLIIGGNLEHPDVNVPLMLDGRPVIPDFRWPRQSLVVEADGAAWHDNRLSREDDAERQALLEAHGERILRVTWEQAITRPRQTLARIRAAGAPAAGGPAAGTPAAGGPAAGAPAAGGPAAGAPAAGGPAAGAPAAGGPAAGAPAAGTPTAGGPAAGTPAGGASPAGASAASASAA